MERLKPHLIIEGASLLKPPTHKRRLSLLESHMEMYIKSLLVVENHHLRRYQDHILRGRLGRKRV